MAPNGHSQLLSCVSRYSLAMAALSSIFWVTSWPPAWLHGQLEQDFPNCVAARWSLGEYGLGCVSHKRISCLFMKIEEDPCRRRTNWSERADGHFCGFLVPPANDLSNPEGFSLYVSASSLGWNCPYWMMAVIWTALFLKTRTRNQFQTRDMLWATMFFAFVITAIRLRITLLPIVWLNLSTMILLLIAIVSAARLVWQSENILWPFLLSSDEKISG